MSERSVVADKRQHWPVSKGAEGEGPEVAERSRAVHGSGCPCTPQQAFHIFLVITMTYSESCNLQHTCYQQLACNLPPEPAPGAPLTFI
jgi:hypothetical protein